jgi:hypothetical protein
MADEALKKESTPDFQWYEDDIPIRGCELSLQKIKLAYRELSALTTKEGQRIIAAAIQKNDGETDDDFATRKEALLENAFRLTVSIIGFDGQNAYGESEAIFESKTLPLPIKTIYFTNITAFKRNTEGHEPANRFEFWYRLEKPLLFDPNPLLSDPTPNGSHVVIRADDVTYIRAVQTIVGDRLRSKRKWYSFIHERFAYDIGLWFVAMPYALYWVTVFMDHFLPADGKNSSFRVAFFIYGMVLSLIGYRAMAGYLKWAFPVNTLEENKDRATGHRVVIAGVLLGAVGPGIRSLFAKMNGF